MKKLRLGIIGCSDIAYRRFLPALKKSPYFEYVGVASRDNTKTLSFIDAYGGKGYSGYEKIINDSSIDALYIPLPPALHAEWGRKALEKGKHILMEKPFTTSLDETRELVNLAKKNNLAIFENYMFKYHNQLNIIKKIIAQQEIGEIRAYRIAFGFPMRGQTDFRYNKELGGGALLDCGGYTIKLASMLLGDNVELLSAKLNFLKEYDVDIFGSLMLESKITGITAQAIFGMDNSYKCELEVWGNEGCIKAPRIFTAPADFKPSLFLDKNNEIQNIEIDQDDQFLNSINQFYKCIASCDEKQSMYKEIYLQSHLIDEVIRRGTICK